MTKDKEWGDWYKWIKTYKGRETEGLKIDRD
jgi:hypothetical protein